MDRQIVESDGVTLAILDGRFDIAGAAAAAAVEAVIAAARAFAGLAPQSDDITCLGLRRAEG